VLKVRVRTGSALIGQTASEVGFRDKYKAAIMGLKREGGVPEGRLGDAVFKAGDILLLHCLDQVGTSDQ